MNGDCYEFDSTGGCERCDAMGGIYNFEPSRPHPNCDCEIKACESPREDVPREDDGLYTEVVWEIVSGPEFMEAADGRFTWEVEFKFSLECPDGREKSTSHTYGVNSPSEDDADAVLNSAVNSILYNLDDIEAELFRKCLEEEDDEDEGPPVS